ncbi:MAG: cytidylate kinase [Bacillota bacterium]|nr:MAG: cytidylate kinase [Bacillota bacterium]
MNKKLVITVGRQYGSGGREIGEKLAAHYGIGYYDKQLLAIAAKESGLCDEIVEHYDEKKISAAFMYPFTSNVYSYGIGGHMGTEKPLGMQVFFAVSGVIKKIAAKESCVIVGRCADYILRDNPDLFSVFVCADDKERVERIMRRNDIKSEKEAFARMMKTDKNRARFYNYYSDCKWGAADTYDLCVKSSFLGIDKTVETICGVIDRL